MVKNLPANAGDIKDAGSITGSGRSPGGAHGSLLQWSCLENPMDRGAWQATIHRVAQSQTLLKQIALTHAIHINKCTYARKQNDKFYKNTDIVKVMT